MSEQSDARTRLREIALDLFGRQGIRVTSTREILNAAGLKNPSAISYHFGSKAELVDDLAGDVIQGSADLLPRQTELATGPTPPSVEDWAALAVDSAVDLISTERGCLLACMWAEYDADVKPNRLELFLGSDNPVAVAWAAAVNLMLPDLPRYLGVTRNVIVFRTLEWMVARRASRMLAESVSPGLMMAEPAAFRQLLLETVVGILTAPTRITDEDITLA